MTSVYRGMTFWNITKVELRVYVYMPERKIIFVKTKLFNATPTRARNSFHPNGNIFSNNGNDATKPG